MEEDFEKLYAMPRIGDKAPDFEANTTIGPIKFSEYQKDKWVILFSHPADFTPVCTTELAEFARDQAFFDQRNTRLLGLSIDSVHSHIAWVKNVKEKIGAYMQFPIIADLDMNVAKLYGMIHPNQSDTATVRAVFFIDPDSAIRMIMYYPLNLGRNMDEIRRVLIGLQTVDEYNCALPVNWHKGDKVIVAPPKTLKELEERESSEYEQVDFYLMKKDL